MIQLEGNFTRSRATGLFLKPKLSAQKVILRDAAGKILYACVGRTWNGRAWAYTKPSYYSADGQGDAALQFRRRHAKIVFEHVFAAPAIGFFAHDDHGDKLSAGGARRDGAKVIAR